VIEAELRELQAVLSRPQESVADADAPVGDKNVFKEQVNFDLVNLRGKMRSSQKLKEDLESDYMRQLALASNLPAEQMQFARMIDQKTRLEEDLKQADSVIKVADMLLKLGKGDIEVYSPAQQAYPPDSLFVNLLPLLGFFFGIGLGALMAVVLEIADSHIRTQLEVESSYTVPCAITVPEVPLLSARNAVERLEYYVSYLDGIVSRRQAGKNQLSIGLASSCSGEGKSTLAYCWAHYLFNSGKRVAIVEFDPTPNNYFGSDQVAQRPLEDYLWGEAGLDEIIWQQDIARIKARDPKRIKDGLSRSQASKLIPDLHTRYDVVIVDFPGILDEDYSLDLFHLVDETLFVIGSNKITRRYVDAALRECEQARVRPLSIVLNRALKIFVDDARVDMASKKASAGYVRGVKSWFAGK
jgi:Mrp family chromosome partitioning ATPase